MTRGSAYAKGKWALGECARSGRKMLLRNMIADGYYPNLIVDPEWYEPKHPQESLPSVRDPVALYRPAPDRDQVSAVLSFGAVAGLDPVPGGGFGDSGGGGATGGGSGASSVQFGYETAAVLLTEVPKPTSYNSPSAWTLIEGWDTNNGAGMNEMASIDSAFNNLPRGGGAVWNLDGTRLTLCSSSDDFIRSFICSTPFDPDTASLSASRAVTNPAHMYMNPAGSILWVLVVVGDEISALPCSNFIIGAGAELSDLTKADCGWTGSGDGGYAPMDDQSYMIYDGTIPGGRTRRVDFSPFGDLDGFSLSPIEIPPYTVNAAIGASKISKDEAKFYRAIGAGGIETITMSTPGDPSTMSRVIDNITATIGFNSDHVIVNPENTEEVWIVGDNAGLQLARMATNV